mmetsp:Transcript_1212/g.3509  ORF Transcript_1212/g.3509 Transcript_1212/m.3509 type:complete len:216 (-) Transcript_1212:498-1145(-)
MPRRGLPQPLAQPVPPARTALPLVAPARAGPAVRPVPGVRGPPGCRSGRRPAEVRAVPATCVVRSPDPRPCLPRTTRRSSRLPRRPRRVQSHRGPAPGPRHPRGRAAPPGSRAAPGPPPKEWSHLAPRSRDTHAAGCRAQGSRARRHQRRHLRLPQLHRQVGAPRHEARQNQTPGGWPHHAARPSAARAPHAPRRAGPEFRPRHCRHQRACCSCQ